MNKPQPDSRQTLATLYERAWVDPAFAALLDHDPKAAVGEIYGPLPEGIEVKVVRDSASLKHLHIPAAPTSNEVSDADLIGAQGGPHGSVPARSCPLHPRSRSRSRFDLIPGQSPDPSAATAQTPHPSRPNFLNPSDQKEKANDPS